MSQTHDNSGAIFKNDKEGIETRPDYKGSAIIGGKKFWVSSWVKQSGDNPKFLSLAFEPAEEKPKTTQRKNGASKKQDDMPF